MTTVLIPLFTGFEEIEALAPIDLLRRAGVEVTTAGVDGSGPVTGRSGIAVLPDAALDTIESTHFDLLFLPGGPGVMPARENGRLARLARRHADAGAWVAAICAAPLFLHDAGLLENRRFTAHSSVVDALPGLIPDATVIRDERILTARGAGTALELGLLMVAVLTDSATARRIADSIHFPHNLPS